ncbi:unnamed protein product [Prunus armeniaca]
MKRSSWTMNHLQMTRLDWAEEYREEQMEYDGELDEETEAFRDLGINMVFILLEMFRAVEGQESTLEGDVFSQKSFECRLAEVDEALEQKPHTAKTGETVMKLGVFLFPK